MRLAAALALLVLVGCSSLPTGGDEARAVVNRFIAARQARNLEATMACFGDQPELHSSAGPSWSGREAVRTIISGRLTDNYVVTDVLVSGDRVSWSERVTRNTGAPPTPGAGRTPPTVFDQEVEVVVVDGRIARLTMFAAGARPTASGAVSGWASPGRDLLVPLSVLVLVGAAVLVWPTAPLPEREHQGQLIRGLREYVARRG